MKGRFAGKVVIVTGGGTGIGRGIASRFGREGAEVVVAGRRADPLNQVVAALTDAGGKAWARTRDSSRGRMRPWAGPAYGPLGR